MIGISLCMLLGMSGGALAWTRTPFVRHPTVFLSSHVPETDQETATTSENPCWQDFYDDDCSMTNIAAAHFVASEWIKSMPCGAGIEDCDMPPDLTVPETRPEAGIDHVDVMGFLGLKRSKTIESDTKTEENKLLP